MGAQSFAHPTVRVLALIFGGLGNSISDAIRQNFQLGEIQHLQQEINSLRTEIQQLRSSIDQLSEKVYEQGSKAE